MAAPTNLRGRACWSHAIASVLIITFISGFPDYLSAQVRYVPDVDEMTDEDRSRVTIASTDLRVLGGRVMDGAYLVIRCEGATDFSVFAVTSEFLDSDPIRTMWRFDENAAFEQRMNASTEGTGVFAGDDARLDLVDGLAASNAVLLRAWDYRGTSHTYEFRLAGSAAALARLPCIKQVRDQYELETARRADSEPWRAFPAHESFDVSAIAHPRLHAAVKQAVESEGWSTFFEPGGFAPTADLRCEVDGARVAIFLREAGVILRTISIASADREIVVRVTEALRLHLGGSN